MGGGGGRWGINTNINPPCKGYRYLLEQHYMIFSVLLLPVCIKFLTNFAKKLTDEDMKSIDKIDEKFRAVCKKAKTKENRFVSRVMFVIEMC